MHSAISENEEGAEPPAVSSFFISERNWMLKVDPNPPGRSFRCNRNSGALLRVICSGWGPPLLTYPLRFPFCFYRHSGY